MKKFLLALILLACASLALAQNLDVAKSLEGFDEYMAKVLKDWNGPAIGVGIVAGDKLVFAKGYGYRDYEKKLPFTPGTVCPIASNTKLFTAVAAGMLVEEGKLTWDKPVRESVPTVRFYNEQLNNSVTLRDMLSHRTGITRHDTIWFKSDFTRKELFDRLKYLEPQEPMRQTFLYNNLMFAGVGYMIEQQSGKPWEQFVRDRILQPLDMQSTGYTISGMVKQPEHGVGFTEKRDSFDIYRIPYYEDIEGVAPCGAIVSDINDLSHWLIALMNDGKYQGKQVLPADVLDQTPWIQRMLDLRLKGKEAGKQARTKAGQDRVADTKPSHPLADYVGDYEHPAYGVMKIASSDNQLRFDFHKIKMPMTHFHYDRFDTLDDEENGKWSVNFRTNPQGDIEQAVMSLDESEAVFTRKPEKLDPKMLGQLAGTYETATGVKIQVTYQEASGLAVVGPGAPPQPLNQVKGLRFRMPQFSDIIFEFVVENGQVKALKQKAPGGEFTLLRK